MKVNDRAGTGPSTTVSRISRRRSPSQMPASGGASGHSRGREDVRVQLEHPVRARGSPSSGGPACTSFGRAAHTLAHAHQLRAQGESRHRESPLSSGHVRVSHNTRRSLLATIYHSLNRRRGAIPLREGSITAVESASDPNIEGNRRRTRSSSTGRHRLRLAARSIRVQPARAAAA